MVSSTGLGSIGIVPLGSSGPVLPVVRMGNVGCLGRTSGARGAGGGGTTFIPVAGAGGSNLSCM